MDFAKGATPTRVQNVSVQYQSKKRILTYLNLPTTCVREQVSNKTSHYKRADRRPLTLPQSWHAQDYEVSKANFKHFTKRKYHITLNKMKVDQL